MTDELEDDQMQSQIDHIHSLGFKMWWWDCLNCLYVTLAIGGPNRPNLGILCGNCSTNGLIAREPNEIKVKH